MSIIGWQSEYGPLAFGWIRPSRLYLQSLGLRRALRLRPAAERREFTNWGNIPLIGSWSSFWNGFGANMENGFGIPNCSAVANSGGKSRPTIRKTPNDGRFRFEIPANEPRRLCTPFFRRPFSILAFGGKRAGNVSFDPASSDKCQRL